MFPKNERIHLGRRAAAGSAVFLYADEDEEEEEVGGTRLWEGEL